MPIISKINVDTQLAEAMLSADFADAQMWSFQNLVHYHKAYRLFALASCLTTSYAQNGS